MSVITISRGSFIGGKMLAERLAQELEFRCIDREVIIEKVAAGGIDHERLREALTRPPSLLDRWITHRKAVYLALLQAALAEEVREGHVVYHGYAGHLLLDAAGPVFRIRIVASDEFRLSLAEKELEMDREDARSYLRLMDEERAKWTRALYGVDWEDTSLYDMVLNLGHLFDIEEAVKLIASAVRGQKSLQFTEARRAVMHDFALASQVRAALAADPATEVVRLDVTARGGVVTIAGTLEDDEQIKNVERIARSVAGVTQVALRY